MPLSSDTVGSLKLCDWNSGFEISKHDYRYRYLQHSSGLSRWSMQSPHQSATRFWVALQRILLPQERRNVSLGYAALSADTLGSRTVAIGYEALGSQNFTTATDAYNTAWVMLRVTQSP